MHSNSDTQRLWLSRASFGLAAAALLSMIHTGCQENDETKLQEAPEQTRVTQDPARQDNQGAQGAKGTEAPVAAEPKIADIPKGADATAHPNPAEKNDPKKAGEGDTAKSGVVADSIDVKRFVVANAVENREPIAAPTFVAGQSDVFAFVELANDADVDQKVVITFEQGDDKVGFVELKVPANQSRWRTWGTTKNIKTAGEWSAVVSTEDGVELKRISFDVESADIPAG